MSGIPGNPKIKLCRTDEHYAGPETTRRVLEIADMITNGSTRHELLQYIRTRYNLKEQSAEQYYDAALRFLIPSPEEMDEYQEKMRAKLLARYENLYKEAVERNSLKIAKEILDSMAKTYGVAGGNGVKITETAEGEKEIEIVFS